MTDEPRIWGDMRENGKDKLIWELENYEYEGNRLAPDPKNGREDSY